MPLDSAVVRQPPWVLEGAREREDDPLLEILHGPRAVEVTALLGDSVLSVRQLRPHAGGGVRPSSSALLLAGCVAVVAGGWLQYIWRPGEGGLAVLLGVALLVLGSVRASRQERSPHFSVGSARGKNDLCLDDPALPDPRFPVVRCRPWGHELLFAPGMQGQVQQGSKIRTLAELRRGGLAWPSPKRPGVWCWPIPRGGRAALRLGAVTLMIRSLAPSRRLPRRLLGRENRAMAPFFVGALVLHAVPLLAVATAPIWWSGSGAGSAAPLQTIRALTVVRSPAAALLTDPSPLPSVGTPRHGVPERLPESTRGQLHTSTPGNPSFVRRSRVAGGRAGLYGLRGPRDNPDLHLARRLAEDAAANKGVLGLLSQRSGSAADELGSRHIGLLHPHLPGNGEGTISLGRLREIVPRSPRVIAGRPMIRGMLDKNIIRKVVRRHINEVKNCYQRDLQVNPALATRVVLSFTIGPKGTVVAARATGTSTPGSSGIKRCIARAARRWRFPPPRPSGLVLVSYPFLIKRADS